MSVPSNVVFQNGINQVNADQLNTFVQGATTYSTLKGFIGVTGMTAYMQGTSAPADGGQGNFYWNATGTNPDDGGVTTIIPNGSSAGNGEWTRISNITGLADGEIFVGNSSNIATAVAMSGGATISPAGVVTLNFSLPQTSVFISGSGTYTTPSGSLYLDIEMVGGGGGGGGSVTSSGGSSGGNTTFGGSLTCNGGSQASGSTAGVGGTATGGDANWTGQTGTTGSEGASGVQLSGAGGGSSSLFGGGGAGVVNAAGGSAIANTGGGGAGGGATGAQFCGGGGGAGGSLKKRVASSAATSYLYTVGAGGSAATGTNNGGAGAAGIIIVTAYFQ